MANYPVHFEKQLTGSACGGANCNMASAAMLADRMSLGEVDVTPDTMRTLSGTAYRCTDGISGNDGTSQADALRALLKLGLEPRAYTTIDLTKMRESARKGMILSIDYGSMPVSERGDKDFLGNHAVYVNNFAAGLYQLYDPICDGRRAGIPNSPRFITAAVLEKAAEDYKTGGGNVYCIVNPLRTVTPTGSYANIRKGPNRNQAPIGKLNLGQRLETGVKQVSGEVVANQPGWFKVWSPTLGVGYIHSSVAKVVAA